jgi:cGMP-dependent protein kinase 2
MSNERTFTICGMADFLAPEIIKGQGHSLAADWYALSYMNVFIWQYSW